ncbi:MAG: hypothetical protein MJ016_08840, partial [Victivallaceae bacterium]|nr:hypothetical protein [Victivallaceae bacterium]
HMIPEANYAKIFTPERIAQLKAYVEAGGNILFTRCVPAGVIDELLPVELGDDSPVTDDETFFADVPQSETYQGIPGKIPVYQIYKEAAPKGDAEVLSWIRDANDNRVSVFIARKKIGSGTVTFFNVQKIMPTQIRAYENWAYNSLLFAMVVADSAQCKIQTDHLLKPLEAIPERVEIAEADASVVAPELGITDAQGAPEVSGNTVVFANGIKLAAAENGTVSITWPGKDKPLVKDCKIPQLNYSKKQKVFDSATAEAVDIKEDVSAADIQWKFEGIEVSGNEAALKYTAPESEMKWIFKAGKLALDGRAFEGIADRIELLKSPLLVSGVSFLSELDPDDPLYAHRNDCYQGPRGYTAFDMTGKTDADTTSFSGQPFEMLVCENGLYIGNRSYPESCSTQMSRKKNAPTIASRHGMGFGRIKAPLATHYFWRWYADGPERGHNDYLAMYHFMRSMLRRQAGLKELPPYPVAVYGYQLRPEEKDFVITSAAKAGYRFIYPPNPESPIENITGEKNMAVYDNIRKLGARSHIWTAGSYVQGDGGWIINNHPEWFVKDENGKIFKYFKKYPVIDVNNPEFYQWYTEVLSKAISGGVGWVYRDMDMAASGTVNYGLPESPNGLQSQIKFYKFFHDHDCRVSIEGMNPLVIDEYWFR